MIRSIPSTRNPNRAPFVIDTSLPWGSRRLGGLLGRLGRRDAEGVNVLHDRVQRSMNEPVSRQHGLTLELAAHDAHLEARSATETCEREVDGDGEGACQRGSVWGGRARADLGVGRLGRRETHSPLMSVTTTSCACKAVRSSSSTS